MGMRCRRLSAGTIQLQPLHDHVIRCISDCCDMPGIAVGQQVMGARLGTATHVSHSSICSGCRACERGREHVASTSAARRWLEPVNMSPTIALQLQESCCKHVGCPHAICTTCRPSALEGCGHCRAPQARNKSMHGRPEATGCGARGRGPRGEARGAADARIKKRTCAAPRSAPYSTIRAFRASQAPLWLLAWPS